MCVRYGLRFIYFSMATYSALVRSLARPNWENIELDSDGRVIAEMCVYRKQYNDITQSDSIRYVNGNRVLLFCIAWKMKCDLIRIPYNLFVCLVHVYIMWNRIGSHTNRQTSKNKRIPTHMYTHIP